MAATKKKTQVFNVELHLNARYVPMAIEATSLEEAENAVAGLLGEMVNNRLRTQRNNERVAMNAYLAGR